jgi:hypothetical protein
MHHGKRLDPPASWPLHRTGRDERDIKVGKGMNMAVVGIVEDTDIKSIA